MINISDLLKALGQHLNPWIRDKRHKFLSRESENPAHLIHEGVERREGVQKYQVFLYII